MAYYVDLKILAELKEIERCSNTIRSLLENPSREHCDKIMECYQLCLKGCERVIERFNDPKD